MAREDYLLLGIFSLLRTLTAHLVPDAPLPTPIKPLSRGWLLDQLQYAAYKAKQSQES